MAEKQQRALKAYTKKEVILGIRPEDIEITRDKKPGNCVPCTIYFKQSMGAEDILNLKSDGLLFKAVAPPSLMSKVGETVFANVDMDRAHLFDSETETRVGE
jgi:multiple sugar transport system ATP-binding protein